jgi:hypothetical protein
MTLPVRLAVVVGGSVVSFGLSILGWGGFAAYISHPALVALILLGCVMVVAAFLSGGNLSAGEREDRGNRWVLAAFGVLGLLQCYLPAYTDRMDFWTIDGDTTRWLGVVLFAIGGDCGSGRSWCLVLGSAAWLPSSAATRWSPRAFTASSATPAISGCWSTR